MLYRRLGLLVERIEEGVIVLLFAAMTIVTFAQVVLRYAFGTGLLWAVEATGYLFGWLVLFGASYVLKHRGHIGVDALVKLFPRPISRYVELLAVALSVIYAGIMVVGGYSYVWSMYTIGIEAEDMPIERWILLSIIPIGLAMFVVRLLQIGWRLAVRGEHGFLIADEVAEVTGSQAPVRNGNT